MYCMHGKFRDCFIFALYALWPKGKFKTELIELNLNEYVRKFKSGLIQD